MMSYSEENDALLQSVLDHTFYKAWSLPRTKRMENFRKLELVLNYKCNLGCKYCYVSRYGDELYPPHMYSDESKILHNLDMYLDFLLEHDYYPEIEFFSGEALVQRIGYQALDMILDKLGNRKHPSRIIIPTNYTFILSDKLTDRVTQLIERSRRVGLPISLSASFDGKYCEGNRPFKYNIESCTKKGSTVEWVYKGLPDHRDDDYYDNCFKFAARYGFGFHPMIYSEHIEDWPSNFLWFQNKFKEYDIRWYNIYLLEVRNPEWSVRQCNDLAGFMTFLIKWLWNTSEQNVDQYFDHLFNHRGFNILSSPLATVGRGMGCSFQSSLYLRLGDLGLMPCHRTSYPQNMIGHYRIEDGRIKSIKALNPELFIAGLQSHAKDWPYCETCLLRDLCSQGCQGAQIETTGDLYTPIPSVCRMEHAKIKGMIQGYKDIGILDSVLLRIRGEKANAINIIDRMIRGEEIWRDQT